MIKTFEIEFEDNWGRNIRLDQYSVRRAIASFYQVDTVMVREIKQEEESKKNEKLY